MSRVSDFAALFGHTVETFKVHSEILDDREAVSQDIITSEESVFFFE